MGGLLGFCRVRLLLCRAAAGVLLGEAGCFAGGGRLGLYPVGPDLCRVAAGVLPGEVGCFAG